MLPPLEDFLSGKIKTLGWGVLKWCSAWLCNPDDYSPGGKGATWKFRPDQAHFVLAFYAVDETGRWIYRRAYRERAKGTGKSPMVAAMACAELLGPVKFSHFDPKTGQAIGKENLSAHVWLAAPSLIGSNHLYSYCREMLEGKAEFHYGLHLGATRILVEGQPDRRIKQVTASPKSLEGPRPTFCVEEETQNWTPSDGGVDLDETIGRQLTKTSARRIAVTNAPRPGLGSVAEMTHQYQKQIEDGTVSGRLLFDTFTIRIEDVYDREQAMPALEIMYEHSPWQDLETVWEDINDPAMDEINARRFFFNEMVEPSALWISETDWDAAAYPRLQLNKRDQISLGFRIRKHCCAVTATRLRDSATFLLKMWERPIVDAPRDWEVPYGEVDLFVRKILDTHNVVYVCSSPNGFADVIGRWQMDYEEKDLRHFEAIWMDRNKTKHSEAVETFEAAVRDKRLKHQGDPDLKRHIMNTFTTEIPQGSLIRMETLHSKKYIVAAEAALLSFQGMIEAIEDGLGDGPPDNEIFGIG